MKLIFSRHGNTFDAATPPTWVGSKNNLPLVETGIVQAKTFAKSLTQSGIQLNAIYCVPLKRTVDYAQIIADELQSELTPAIDMRLNELDYGNWSGLTNQQIIEKFGPQILENWEKNCEWPANGWGSSEPVVRAEVLSFANEMAQKHKPDENILAVTSNGRLRYFLTLVPGEFENHVKTDSIKIKTGNICQLSFSNNQWEFHYWNKSPNMEVLLHTHATAMDAF
jgi:broad specificity phosphatase PhoE